MPRKPLIVKLSSLDAQAPPEVTVMVRLQTPGGRRTVPRRIADYPASELAQAQKHSDLLTFRGEQHGFATWWCKDGKHVKKWPTLMKGKRRNFKVSVPYTVGINDGDISQFIRDAIQQAAHDRFAHYKDEVRVSIDADRNRDEHAEVPQVPE